MDKRVILNKASLIEPIVRHRVQDSLFYKQYLHLTNEQTILPIIIEHVEYIAGTDSSNRPSPFLCCLVRLLEIEPSQDILELYLDQNGYAEFKYLTALAILYSRIVLGGGSFYKLHDRYIGDYRKLRIRSKNSFEDNGRMKSFSLIHIDEWVDQMATQERLVDIKMPHISARQFYIDRGECDYRDYNISDDEKSSEDSDYVSDSD